MTIQQNQRFIDSPMAHNLHPPINSSLLSGRTITDMMGNNLTNS